MLGTHTWATSDNGTARYCAQCRMRVDNDEFVPAVEDSVCVPLVPDVAEAAVEQRAYKPYHEPVATNTVGIRQHQLSDAVANVLELQPGGTNYVDPATGKRVPPPTPTLLELQANPVTFIEFVNFMGFELSPWQISMLATFDNELAKKRRG